MTTSDTWTSESRAAGAYADVNGLHQYYEVHGSGRPLVLLHGGLGSGEMFGPVLDALATNHRVILPDLQGHGRTADIDRPLSLEALGDDVDALLGHLGIDQADVVGYSLGGGAAFLAALRHPERIRRLVLVSVNADPGAIYPEMRAMQGQLDASAAEFMTDTPMYQLYQRVAPRPEDFGRLLDKIGGFMASEADLTPRLRELRVPTLLACGDSEMYPPSYAASMFAELGGGQRDGGWMGEGLTDGGHAMSVLPRQTHYSIFRSPLLAATILAFLDEETASA